MENEGFTPASGASFLKMVAEARVTANNDIARHAIVQALGSENKRLQREARRKIRKMREAGDHDGAEEYGRNVAGIIEMHRRLMVQLWPWMAADINADALDFA